MKHPLHVQQLTVVVLAHLVVGAAVVVATAQTNNTNGTTMPPCGMMSMLENTTLDPSLLLFGGARTFLPNVNGSEATSITAPNGIVSPVAGNTTTCANLTSSPTNNVSSTYGPRLKYSDGGRSDFHLGVDFYGNLGDPLYAIADGVVSAVYMEGSSAYPNGGNVVILEHQFPGGDVPLRRRSSSSPNATTTFMVGKYYSVYLHCLNYTVAAGQAVTSGMQVATMGQTGDTVFTHLHFELRVGSRCSYQYQLANPNSSCAVGYVPHVHPFTILPTIPNADDGGVQQSLCNGSMQASSPSTPSTNSTRNGLTGWYLSTKTPGVNITFPNASSVDFTVIRPNYAVNRLEIKFVRLLNNSLPPNATSCMNMNATNTDGGAIMKAVFDFSTFEGFDPSTLTILDNFTNFTPSVFPGVLVPGEVLSTSTHYNFQATMHAGWAIWQFQVYDVLGNGVSRNNTQWVQLPAQSPSQGANGTTTGGGNGNTTTTTSTNSTTSNTTSPPPTTTLEGSNISGAQVVGLSCSVAVLLPLLLLLTAFW